MALQKEIRQDDDVTTTYHRIAYIDSMINSHISIAVFSYINAESRDKKIGGTNPYVAAKTYETEYQENMTIREAYAFLKTLPEFEGAVDILDDIDADKISGEEFLKMIEEVM